MMVDPSTLVQVKGGEEGLGKEGAGIALGPRRRPWIKYVVIVACLYGLFHWKDWLPDREVVRPVVVQNTAGLLGPTTYRAAPVVRPSVDTDPDIGLAWVLGKRAGVVIGGKLYVLALGDSVGSISLGMLGPNWGDVKAGTAVRRLTIAYPFPQDGATGVRPNSTSGNVGVAGQGGISSVLPSGPATSWFNGGH